VKTQKLIAYSALAILIGFASIMPALFLMSSTVKAQTDLSKPWSNINIPYAYCKSNSDFSNITGSYYGTRVIATGNITIFPYALEDADAKIEYYQLQVYSDQGLIYNITYFVGVSKSDYLTNIHTSTLYFTDGHSYSTNVTSGRGGTMFYDLDKGGTFLGLISSGSVGPASESLPQEVTQLRNANKLYINVSRLCTFTFKGNTTIATMESKDVIQHIELSKIDNGFIYESAADLHTPFSIDGPAATYSPPNILTPIIHSNLTIPASNAILPKPSVSHGWIP